MVFWYAYQLMRIYVYTDNVLLIISMYSGDAIDHENTQLFHLKMKEEINANHIYIGFRSIVDFDAFQNCCRCY